MHEHRDRWFGITKDDVILVGTISTIVVLPLSAGVLYAMISAMPPEIFNVVLAVFGTAGIPVGAFVAWYIVRWTNQRDDRLLQRPCGARRDGESLAGLFRDLRSVIGCSIAGLAAPAVRIDRALTNIPVATTFRVVRTAFVTAVMCCTAILAVALYVRVPGKLRPGTRFSNDVVAIVLEICIGLFFVGAFWCLLARTPRESRAIRMSVYAAFVDMALAQLVVLQML